MINPILEMAIQKSELWNLKSEFRNHKSEIRIQKSEIANRNPWKSEILNWEFRDQKPDFRNATCDIQFWQSRFIPVYDVIISNIESIKSSTFPLPLSCSKCVTLAPASISHFTSSGGKQFCNDVYISLSIKFGSSSLQFSREISMLLPVLFF